MCERSVGTECEKRELKRSTLPSFAKNLFSLKLSCQGPHPGTKLRRNRKWSLRVFILPKSWKQESSSRSSSVAANKCPKKYDARVLPTILLFSV